MNESNFSCIKQVTKTVNLTIPLKYTSNEIAGVTEILDGWKRQFVPKLQGVVVSYKNIRLTSRSLFIHASRTAPQYAVTATFDVFCPSIGDIVKGKINRTSREHIGCLIEGTINATIHLPYNSYPKVSKFMRINHDILFEINRFESNRHTLRVNGQITPRCIELMEELFPDIEDEPPENVSNGLKNSLRFDDDGNTSSDSSSRESKLHNESNVEIKEEMKTEVESDSDESSSPSPKLKNSKKRKKDGESSSLNLPENSKKRKRDSESSSLNSPEVSKKKKQKVSEFVIKSEKVSSDESNATSKKSKKQKERFSSSNYMDFDVSAEIKNERISSDELNATPKKKKKRKEVSSSSNNFDSNLLALESQLAAFNPDSSAYLLGKIKEEILSPTSSTASSPTSSTASSTVNQKKGKKRKLDFSSSEDKKKKKHKSKDSKKNKKKSKDKKKSGKGKLVASGDIFKKDKKKSKKKKDSSKKDKKKKKRSKKDDDDINVSVSIKSEFD